MFFGMHTPRSRRRFVIVAIVIWVMMLPILWLIVPPQPRLVIGVPNPSRIIGTTSDDGTMYTACLATDEEVHGWLPTGLVKVWDLTTGRERHAFQIDQS